MHRSLSVPYRAKKFNLKLPTLLWKNNNGMNPVSEEGRKLSDSCLKDWQHDKATDYKTVNPTEWYLSLLSSCN